MTNPAQQLRDSWAKDPRWAGIRRTYTAEDVVRLRGSVQIEHTLARLGAEKLWRLVNTEPYVNCLGALTGGQAMQQVRAGIKAIYLSGWQVAADNNSYMSMYPDQSLYPVDSVPKVVERINSLFRSRYPTPSTCAGSTTSPAARPRPTAAVRPSACPSPPARCSSVARPARPDPAAARPTRQNGGCWAS